MQWHVNISCINNLRPRRNGHHFAEDIFKRIYLNENIWIMFKNLLEFVPKGLINNIPVLFLIMAWRRPGGKPLSELMLVRSLTHICVTRPQWVDGPLSGEPPMMVFLMGSMHKDPLIQTFDDIFIDKLIKTFDEISYSFLHFTKHKSTCPFSD